MAQPSAISDDLTDLSSNVAITLLKELQDRTLISSDVADKFKNKFIKAHDILLRSTQNYKELYQKTKKLKADIFTEKTKYDTAYNAQSTNQEIMEELNHILQKSHTEHEQCEHRTQILDYEYSELEREMIDRESKIVQEKNEMEKRYEPTIEKLKIDIKENTEYNEKKVSQIENNNNRLKELQDKLVQLKNENEKHLEDKEQTKENLNKIKEEPKRISKNSDMQYNAHVTMKKELQDIQEEIIKKDKYLAEQKHELQRARQRHDDHNAVVKVKSEEMNTLSGEIEVIENKIGALKSDYTIQHADRVECDTELKALFRKIRSLTDEIQSLKKQIDQYKKDYKGEDHRIHLLKDQIREYQITEEKLEKNYSDYFIESSKQKEIQTDMQNDKKLLEWKRKLIDDDTETKKEQIKRMKKDVIEYEKQLADMQSIEANAIKTVKNLTAVRESMARKASTAMLEVKETREELKIKQLLILDLTKKQQEIEFKLNSYKVLYEEVKGERNKYANMIQNSSQDRAELKERIKIIENELEILKNESAEKDRTLMDLKHIFQSEVHRRDKRHAKLNKYEFTRRQKKERVDQQINEIEKQNMIILSLEKEMHALRHEYESKCEDRNYTGIQLIDRNDELCILYEKANIQENILRNGERDIQALEDDNRMIKIECDEVKRKIEVARKNITEVPKLADEVIQIKNELQIEKDKERKLANQLEDPNNKSRWRDLGGDDPDQEALEAKIQVLEERLNNKKEALLEKELILDEITNLSEKLRAQALDDRQSSLQLSEKVNEFQVRLKTLTRKMMATISELSMFQATSLKLKGEKDTLENVIDDASERVHQGLPPTPETEIEYQKMVRDKARYESEREMRMQREAFEKSMPPFAVKTTATPRVQQYIPPGGLGLPRPYGNHAPFKPSEIGTNARHIKKPNPRDIEI